MRKVSERTRRDAGLSEPDLWLRYFALGGMRSPAEVHSYLRSGGVPSAHDHDVLAHALNERFSELGRNHPVRYAGGGAMSLRPARSSRSGDVQLGLLGSFSLQIDAESIPLPMSSQRLVSFLALHDGTLLRRHVAGSLWGDTSEHLASGSLRSALWRLGPSARPVIEVVGAHLHLAPTVEVDLRTTEALAHRILDRSLDLAEGDLDEAPLSHDLLPDWSEDWVLVRRESHAQLRLRALEALCRRLSDAGRFGQAVQVGTLAVSAEPLRESAQRALIAAHLADGNAAAAMKRYESFRALLRAEIGLEPSDDMLALVDEMHP